MGVAPFAFALAVIFIALASGAFVVGESAEELACPDAAAATPAP